ncbi:MAG: hypothetical protein QOF33_1717 [Thermomicrobiales bacterium]|jgi:hypothetical protein|nr:hypothetical protein [Thermomicrobiales bacterium]MEA2527120.1 hypothetical protein [Thermomicrobiales bacterium]MEA2583632.1 hypothetical protein [Thermomicrobiales bacterium]MEA2595074.1 hypothetical protein [Thermomicrobiales bacterium]
MAGTQQWYRVVYFVGGKVHGLGRVLDMTPSRYSLDPFRSRLLLAGITGGHLALVNERTGVVAARRPVGPRPRG